MNQVVRISKQQIILALLLTMMLIALVIASIGTSFMAAAPARSMVVERGGYNTPSVNWNS